MFIYLLINIYINSTVCVAVIMISKKYSYIYILYL